jgi:hypothetical protein
VGPCTRAGSLSHCGGLAHRCPSKHPKFNSRAMRQSRKRRGRPIAEAARSAMSAASSLDHLVGAGEDVRRER